MNINEIEWEERVSNKMINVIPIDKKIKISISNWKKKKN